MTTQPAPILVGYDGSPGSQSALQWAAAEAARELAPLRIVEAFEIVITTRPSPGQVVPLEAVRAARAKGLDAAADSIRALYPNLRVETRLVGGAAAKALLDEAAGARLVVLGSRGMGGWSGLLVGSVAVQVTTHAQCPVIVIPHDLQIPARDGLTVVVGVDGSEVSARAINFAFDQAERIGAHIVALYAWTSPLHTYAPNSPSLLQLDEQKIEEEAQVLVAESVAGAAADHPDVTWTTELVSGSPARALVHRSASADLVVVGTRGRGGFTGLLLGSVSQSVLHHTKCPIAVVR